jgi:CRP-like cAMP-binding protein
MKIERIKIKLEPVNLEQIRDDGSIKSRQAKDFRLNNLQFEFLSLMQRRFSIRDVVYHYFDQQICIPFKDLHKLIVFLVHERLIQNPEFLEYFKKSPRESSGYFDSLKHKVFGDRVSPKVIREEIEELPFFRSMKPEILDLLVSQARAFDISKNITICRAGQDDRSLLVLLRGQASVYRIDETGKSRKMAVLTSGSVFGEVGFFLGQPRGANVVTDVDSLVIQIKYNSELFDGLIKTDKAIEIQQRIWVIHALLKSDVFRNIPQDCFDALIFSGCLKTFKANQRLMNEGERGSTCSIIIQGLVSVEKKGIRVGLLSAGDSLGEVALLLTGGFRSATVHSETEVLALEIPMNRFYELLAMNLSLACEFERLAEHRTRGMARQTA